VGGEGRGGVNVLVDERLWYMEEYDAFFHVEREDVVPNVVASSYGINPSMLPRINCTLRSSQEASRIQPLPSPYKDRAQIL
jgi:hypothetical protein